jgi:hypothetical protein
MTKHRTQKHSKRSRPDTSYLLTCFRLAYSEIYSTTHVRLGKTELLYLISLSIYGWCLVTDSPKMYQQYPPMWLCELKM